MCSYSLCLSPFAWHTSYSLFPPLEVMCVGARCHHANKPFGSLSIILWADWNQLPPVGFSALFKDASDKRKGRRSNKQRMKATGHYLYMLFEDPECLLCSWSRWRGSIAMDDQAIFCEELNWISEGKFAIQEWEHWKQQSLDMLPPRTWSSIA